MLETLKNLLFAACLGALGVTAAHALEVAPPDGETAESALASPEENLTDPEEDPLLVTVPSSGADLMKRGEVGLASFYGKEFRGRKTASGHAFDPGGMTAAHRTLPLGTEIRITNLQNGRTVTAVVNDRGPFVRGRIVDVTHALARQLDFVRAGMARVKVEVLGWSPLRKLRESLTRER